MKKYSVIDDLWEGTIVFTSGPNGREYAEIGRASCRERV